MRIKKRLPLMIVAILLQMALVAVPAKSATFMVTSAADSGSGSLRWAIEQANGTVGTDTILFDGDYILYPLSELPPLRDNAGTAIDGDLHMITIDFSQTSTNKYGLKLASDNNIVRNLRIKGVKITSIVYPEVWGAGIWVTGSYNLIYGCRLYSNELAGILLGQRTFTDPPFADHNKIQACMIGTSDGVIFGEGNGKNYSPKGQPRGGIYGDSQVRYTVIGVDGDGVNDENEGNLISGNIWEGINLAGPGPVIAGNFIGTDITGTNPLPNQWGVDVMAELTTGAIIGTNGDGISDDLEGNLISGDAVGGVSVGPGTRFSGNFVGVDVTGKRTIGNSGYNAGVTGYGENILIGTNADGISDELERNIISTGIGFTHYKGMDNLRIAGNYIGTDVTGTIAIGYWGAFHLSAGSRDDTVNPESVIIIGTNGDGIRDAIEANVISKGISLRSWPNQGIIRVSGNFIGTDKTGTVALPNSWTYPIISLIAGPGMIVGTNGDGLNDRSEGNIIVGRVDARALNSTIAGNYLGVDPTGIRVIGVGTIELIGASDSIIGTNGDGISDELEGNVIAGPGGVSIRQGNNNRISGNYIGLGADGQTPIGALSYGIIQSPAISSSSIIGTNGDGISDDLEGNVIIANGAKGVGIWTSGGNYTTIAGNFIGTNRDGSLKSGFGTAGIRTHSNTRIGTDWNGVSDALEANIIANNGFTPSGTPENDGIVVWGHYNTINGNSIYNNAGQGIDLISGANLGIAAPSIVTVNHDGNSYVASGTAPAGSRVEIYIADASTVGGGGEGKIYLDRMLATDGTFTFHLNNIGVDDFLTATATDVNGNTSEFSQTMDFTGHLPPVINSIADQMVDTGTLLTFAITATSPHGLPVVITTELPAGASFDGTNFAWTPEFNQAGLTYVTFVANDGQSTTAKTVTITVNAVNSPPVLAINGGGVFNLQDVIVLGAEVSDADGDQLTYSWTEGATILCTGTMITIDGGVPVKLPNCQLPVGQALGIHIYGLEINDGYNLPVTGTVAATVQDSSAPTLAPTVDRTLLWPPNHEMVNVLITSNASDDSGCLSLDVAVSSNEPESGMADGDNFPDFSEPLIDPQTGIVSLQLRAERDGRGDGRIYQVAIIATDCAGNTSSTTLEVLCPHDRKNYSNE